MNGWQKIKGLINSKHKNRFQWAWDRAKKVSVFYWKSLVNAVCIKVGKKALYEIKLIDRMSILGTAGFPNHQINWMKKWWNLSFSETTLGWSVVILILCLLLIYIFGGEVTWKDASVEWWGLIFDVCVILIGFGAIQHHRQRRDEINRQHELIEDFKRWKSDEAKHRILGAIRRLNKLGLSKIDFTNGFLNDACLQDHGVETLSQSSFERTAWNNTSNFGSEFERVDFSKINCTDVQFSSGFLDWNIPGKGSNFTDCAFVEADLTNAQFDFAELNFPTPPISIELEEVPDKANEKGVNTLELPNSFQNAELRNASFIGCKLNKADFRGAENIETVDFRGGEGLETCLFDNDEITESVIAQSKEPLDD